MSSSNSNIGKIEERLKFLQKNKNFKTHWNITWNLGVILSNLVKLKEPKYVLEVGTSNGFSSLWIAKGLSDWAKLFTIEANPGRFAEACKNFQYCSLFEQNIFPINGEVFEILSVKNFDFTFDFVFLDAAQKSYLEIIETLEDKKLLSNDALIVADNILTHDYMSEFVDNMKSKGYLCEVIELDSGFLVAKRV